MCQAELVSGKLGVQKAGCWQRKSSAVLYSQPTSLLTVPSSAVFPWLLSSKWNELFYLTRPIFYTATLTVDSLSLSLPQSTMSVPAGRICVMRTPSAPIPSEDTCVPASRAMWAMAPSAGVSSCLETAPQTHTHTRLQTWTFVHIL